MPQPTDTELDDEQQSEGAVPDESPEESTDADTAESDEGAEGTDSEGTDSEDDPDGEPETFPREYVEKLRKESAGYRERAQRADQLAERLHTALVAATGRLADPTDLPFDAAHLDDADALSASVDELLARKPHLKSRRVVGDVGQGAGGVTAGAVDLAAMLRSRA